MQPLGLARAQHAAYVQLLVSPHDFEIEADILDMEEHHVGSLRAQLQDGQVNLTKDGQVHRTATFTLYDPDHGLHLDPDSPFEGALYADRLVRIRHVVDLPGVGRVAATPFIGPPTRLARTGDDLTLTCSDKTILATSGTKPKTVGKGANAVEAIHDFLYDRAGERHFRLPQGSTKRLSRSYSCGWKHSVWSVCQKIARNELDMQLVYSCDGYVLLRHRPSKPVLVLDDAWFTGPVTTEQDMESVRNLVRVIGDIAPVKTSPGSNRKKPPKPRHVKVPPVARAGHPLSPEKLGRNDVPRYLPDVIDVDHLKSRAQARSRAQRRLANGLKIEVSASANTVPFFHLDYGDIVEFRTDDGTAHRPMTEDSFPLGLNGDASVGIKRVVSRPRRSR